MQVHRTTQRGYKNETIKCTEVTRAMKAADVVKQLKHLEGHQVVIYNNVSHGFRRVHVVRVIVLEPGFRVDKDGGNIMLWNGRYNDRDYMCGLVLGWGKDIDSMYNTGRSIYIWFKDGRSIKLWADPPTAQETSS